MDEYANQEKIYNNNNHCIITQSLIDEWVNKLMTHKRKDTILLNDNNSIYNFMKLNQIKNDDTYILEKDINRTRVKEKKSFPNFNRDLSNMLLYYCKTKNIPYKQGMNEILGVIYLLNQYNNIHLEIYQIFNIFSLIIDFFFTNYYTKDTFIVLRSSSEIVRILLKYHEPHLSSIFDASFVESQIYSTIWLLNVSSGKFSIDVAVSLFNSLIQEMNQTKIFYIIISFLIYYKNEFVYINDLSRVFDNFSKLTINTITELNEILKISNDIQISTPFSINLLIDSLEIFVPNSKNIDDKYKKIQPNLFLALPIFPIEIIYYLYPNVMTCPDLNCRNCNIYSNDLLKWPKGQRLCELCRRKSNGNSNNIHLEIFSLIKQKETNKKKCKLQNVILLKNHYFKKSQPEQEIKEECQLLKDNTHIVLLTSLTLNFTTIENKLYTLEIDENEENLRKYGLSWNDKEKELQTEEAFNFIGNNQKKENEIDEYDILRKTIKLLYDEKHKYVSFVYGGYHEIHRLAYSMELKLDSNRNDCPDCIKMKGMIKGAQLTRINEDEYKEYINKKEKKMIYDCMLKTKQTKLIVNEGKMRLFTKITSQEGKYVYRAINKDNVIAFEKNGEKVLNVLYTQNLTFSKLRNIKIEFINVEDMDSVLKECFNM